MNSALLWEIIKLKIREHSIKYATAKKAKISRREEQLEKEINTLQHLIDSNEINTTDRADVFNSLENKRRELESIIEYKTKGSILRARCRRFNEGEKNTKYFLNLEKRHFKQATISQLKQTDGSFVTTDKEILNHCEAFYKELYRSKISSTGDKYDDLFFDEPSQEIKPV